MAISNILKRQIREARTWLALNAASVTELTIAADPRPESLRAVARGRAVTIYKGALYAEFLAESVRQLTTQKPSTPLSGDIIGVVEIICTKPKTTKRKRPGGDLDNLEKGIQDAITQAGIWDDDDSLVSLTVIKRWADPGEQGGAKVAIGVLKDD